MNRAVVWIIVGAVIIGAAGAIIATAEQTKGPPLIAGDQPVNEQQVRQKLQSDGWSNVKITHEGRYYEASGSKDGRAVKVAVDSQPGRLRSDGDDDDD